MKSTLLQMVQSILSDMDAEDVNSIADTVEAQQIASVIEDVYYNIIAGREIPEHKQLVQLTSLSNSARPTHFTYPANLKSLVKISYNVSTGATPSWREIKYRQPDYFLENMDETGLAVTTVVGGVTIYVSNDKMPSYYTSFDDNYIIMDAYDANVETNLQQSKTRAYASAFPTFSQTDAFEPDLDETLFPYFLAEAKSTCFSLFKSGSDPKVEQAARRLKSYIRNDMWKTKQANKLVRPNYGR
jgi:hypothetical protein